MDTWAVPTTEPAPTPHSSVEQAWRLLTWGSFALLVPVAATVPVAAGALLLLHRVALVSWIGADARARRLKLPACRELLLQFTWSSLLWYLPYSRGLRGVLLWVGYWAWLAVALVVGLVSLAVWGVAASVL